MTAEEIARLRAHPLRANRSARGAEVNPFLSVTLREMTRSRRERYNAFACDLYCGDTAVLRERLKAATTPQECDAIFHAWCAEARDEVPK